MSELGDVVKYEISKDNLIVSHNLISEFTRFSQDIFVMDGAAFKTNVDFFYRPMDILFQHRGARALGEIFSTIYLHKFIQLDSIFYEEILKKVVRKTSTELNNDMREIKDVSNFISIILHKHAIIRIFGKNLSNSALLKNALEAIPAASYLSSYYEYNIFKIIRGFLKYRDKNRNTKIISDLISDNLKNLKYNKENNENNENNEYVSHINQYN
ncbi:hypothetical protein BB561_006914 [Smittium simulii]|uniref:Uncharacterized protein n=1 Tax=Smittium simulii TaxID=133385 RepID=A0A2T9Y029_9FUNG|nr:hypothetical protein BB561_006914 [Smittium simulii]